MKFSYLVAIVLVAQVGIVLSETECKGPNEAFDPCRSTCDNPETCEVSTVPCTVNCEPGCYCKAGYKRTHSGVCVPVEQCAACPKPNEYYSPCGPACNQNCGENVLACTRQCVAGCFCIDGYKRTLAGDCVPVDECCDQCKRENEMYTTCGSKCEEKCDKKYCAPECLTGCFCKPGYKRHPTGKCVLAKECPKCEEGNLFVTYLWHTFQPNFTSSPPLWSNGTIQMQ